MAIEKFINKWSREWNTKSFKFLFWMTLLFITSWITLQILKPLEPKFNLIFGIIRIFLLSIYIISLIIYNLSAKRWKNQKIFEKTLAFFNIFMLTLFAVFYIIILLGFLKLMVFVLIVSTLAILSLNILYHLLNLLQCKKLWSIILAYVALSFGIIIFFGFAFAFIDGIPENSLTSDNIRITEPWDIVYFSSVTYYSLGYGDIVPLGNIMRLASQIEVMLGFIIHIIILGFLISNNFSKFSKRKHINYEETKTKIKTEEPRSKLIKILDFFFVVGTILFFVKFYLLEGPSLYPIAIFLLGLITIIVFYNKISHFEISQNKILIKMKKDQEQDYENTEVKKKGWNFEIKKENKNV